MPRLLLLSSILNAATAVIYFNHAGRGFRSEKDFLLLTVLTIAAGLSTIAAGLRKPALIVNGLALCALGILFNEAFRHSIGFRSVALLVIVSALALGAFLLLAARGRAVISFILATASAAFALAFFLLGFHYVAIKPGSFLDLKLLCAFSAFSALCLLVAALLPGASRPALASSTTPPPAPLTHKECDDDIANGRRSELHEGFAQASLRWRSGSRGVVLRP